MESVKAAFDIYAPVAGTVSAVNKNVPGDPATVNRAPYDNGWLFKLSPMNAADRDALMTHDQYREFVKTATH